MYNPTEDIIFFAACVVSFFQERTFPLVSLSARSLSMTFRNSDDECERERERERSMFGLVPTLEKMSSHRFMRSRWEGRTGKEPRARLKKLLLYPCLV